MFYYKWEQSEKQSEGGNGMEWKLKISFGKKLQQLKKLIFKFHQFFYPMIHRD